MLPVPACGSKTRRWHSHRSACSAVAPGGRTPNRNRGRPCSWPSGRGPRPPPPQSAPSVFAAATPSPTAASGSQSSDRSVENCSLPGSHQGASRWRYSTPANPIKSDRLLGRNEEGGIRCVYHGWKYDVAGNCVDMPSLPPHRDFRRKVRAKAYQVVERCGLVWVYMGVRTEARPLPALEILDVPSDEIGVSLILRECNYLQALEGDIDTSHFGFLHAGHVDPDDLAEGNALRHTITARAPEYHVMDTAWGTQYAAYRP